MDFVPIESGSSPMIDYSEHYNGVLYDLHCIATVAVIAS
jgi:hypothetical protein